MDLIQKISFDHTIVALGHHQGKQDMKDREIKEQEAVILSGLSPRKRAEWIASRELLFQIADLPPAVQCLYDDFGKPILIGSSKQISVSHSELWCAAMVSDISCGVDIQVYSDTVRRIADRFLDKKDLDKVNASNDSLSLLHILWGAKECMYKAYGKRKLGFREHIFIPSLDKAHGRGVGEIRYEGLLLLYDIYFRLLPEVAWVFCVQRPDHFTLPGGKL